MECSDARHLIHLDVGDDLRVDEEAVLAEHMNTCAECRSYHAGMSRALNVLSTLRSSSLDSAESSAEYRSVWPVVSREIERRRTAPAKVRKFNRQVAALSVCSLSLAVVTIVQSLSSMRGSAEPQGMNFVPAQSVSHNMNVRPFQPFMLPARNSGEEMLRPVFIPDTEGGPQSF